MENNIKENSTYTLIEKKSKFIATVFKVNTEEEAKKIINQIKKEHKKANHHVYAYRVLEDNQLICKYSDDKEPTGTAGRPIFYFLEQNDLVNVVAIVTRYFGGTLLGKGGLVRAYTKSVKLALENTEDGKSDGKNFQ